MAERLPPRWRKRHFSGGIPLLMIDTGAWLYPARSLLCSSQQILLAALGLKDFHVQCQIFRFKITWPHPPWSGRTCWLNFTAIPTYCNGRVVCFPLYSRKCTYVQSCQTFLIKEPADRGMCMDVLPILRLPSRYLTQSSAASRTNFPSWHLKSWTFPIGHVCRTYRLNSWQLTLNQLVNKSSYMNPQITKFDADIGFRR